MSDFLASVERRAYKQALFAVRDDEAALDIVQDSMLKLAEKYGDKPAGELPMLFQRILQNTIRDFYRRQKVRSSRMTPLLRLLHPTTMTSIPLKLWRWSRGHIHRQPRTPAWSRRKSLQLLKKK